MILGHPAWLAFAKAAAAGPDMGGSVALPGPGGGTQNRDRDGIERGVAAHGGKDFKSAVFGQIQIKNRKIGRFGGAVFTLFLSIGKGFAAIRDYRQIMIQFCSCKCKSEQFHIRGIVFHHQNLRLPVF